METPRPGPEIEKETEKEKIKREIEEALELFKKIEGISKVAKQFAGPECKEKSEPVDPSSGLSGNKLLEWNPDSEKLIIYKDLFGVEKTKREKVLAHLLGERAIEKGAVNLSRCQEILEKYRLPPQLEAKWINELKKPEDISDKDWQRNLLKQKIAERIACLLTSSGDPLEVAGKRVEALDKDAQEKLKKDKKLKGAFLNETKEFTDYFSQALTEFEKRAPEVEEEKKPEKKKIAESEKVGEREGPIEGILDELAKIWRILTRGKEEKKRPPLEISLLGKVLMKVFDWIETQRALRNKKLEVCMDWALQRSMRGVNEAQDEGRSLNPAQARIRIRFHKLAVEGEAGWRFYPLESLAAFLKIDRFTNKLDRIFNMEEFLEKSLDLTRRLERAAPEERKSIQEALLKLRREETEKLNKAELSEETIKELKEHSLYQFWKKDLHEYDVRDIAGGMAALRAKCSRIDEGPRAWRYIWACNLLLWKLAPRKVERLPEAEKNNIIPRLEYGPHGSHEYSSLEDLLLFIQEKAARWRRWERYAMLTEEAGGELE